MTSEICADGAACEWGHAALGELGVSRRPRRSTPEAYVRPELLQLRARREARVEPTPLGDVFTFETEYYLSAVRSRLRLLPRPNPTYPSGREASNSADHDEVADLVIVAAILEAQLAR